MKVKEFKVNSYITLKLEYDETVIFINKEEFKQCSYILINIQKDKLIDFEEINSIDEANELYFKKNSNFISISPETEFWGHCSNLQVWYENNYDTRILHTNLAFPLLKRLVEVGDFKAKKVFKEEICKRLESGSKKVINFLNEEGYLTYLNHKEVLYALLKTEEAEAIIKIENSINMLKQTEFAILLDLNEAEPEKHFIYIEKNYVRHLNLGRCYSLNTDSLMKCLNHLSYLEYIFLEYSDSSLLDILISMPTLKYINIGGVLQTKKI
ncbi:hypothetical protein LCGC14_1944930 [marine sediment metagenome]|uniref:Leucine-rich repeat domain-containing protein n=1 Tax=marine sediment metagenome TaxID=412755 RepID=A0A0F9HXF6_9ZZZZ